MELLMQGVEYFHKGGFVMYILLLCSVFVITVGVERLFYFAKADSGRKFTEKFYHLMINNKIDEAKNLAANTKGDLASLISFAFNKMNTTHINLSTFLEVQSGISLSKFRARLYYLNVIVTMAPLLGLLGTIVGMISAFSIFNLQEGQAIAITGGVGEALIATATGLCVAILSLAIHAYFVQRIDRIVTDMEQAFSLLEDLFDRGDK
ncbi:MotA/TolQ/ExbB proton channel family protein [Megamonas hypermegale]|uniref:MotA/TolQ/ExbB proton channel family protein n=1 Tax=Megamonas hypermegale TaxID=158847 RepID=A0A921HNJ0_9FIRM|nr:MotA/TolQ/ExbB proton channel family protein [Megamonas hypermegale]MDM8143719.1 MotA/TolQ/ExbB proton channel family protein [Megamonas hypermegale]HJF84633.1 MotA/TolQ/ExbB proton channel family protein [Megamonas hypermegale]